MRDLLPEFLADVARDEAGLSGADIATGTGTPAKAGGFSFQTRFPFAFASGKKNLPGSCSTSGEHGSEDALVGKFLDEASCLNAQIDLFKSDLDDLRVTHGDAGTAVSTKAVAEIARACDEKTSQCSEKAALLKAKIDHLARGGDTFPTDAANRHTQQNRVVETVSAGVRKRFADTVAKYVLRFPNPASTFADTRLTLSFICLSFGNAKLDFQTAREETLKTRYFAKHGGLPDARLVRRALEEEAVTGTAEEMIECFNKTAEAMMAGNGAKRETRPTPLLLLLDAASVGIETSERGVGPVDAGGRVNGVGKHKIVGQQQLQSQHPRDTQAQLDLVRNKRDTALELETGMVQLHSMFLDMAVMIETQGESIDSVETHVARAANFATRSAAALKSARAFQTQRTRRVRIVILKSQHFLPYKTDTFFYLSQMRYACFVVVLIVLVAAAVVASGFRDAM